MTLNPNWRYAANFAAGPSDHGSAISNRPNQFDEHIFFRRDVGLTFAFNLTTNMTDRPDMHAAEEQVVILACGMTICPARVYHNLYCIYTRLHPVTGPALVWYASGVHHATREC